MYECRKVLEPDPFFMYKAFYYGLINTIFWTMYEQ